MRRVLLPVLSVLLVLGAVPGAVAAEASATDLVDRLDVDFDAVRDAMRRGAESVGQPPAEAAEHFADRPLQWFHPTEDAVVQEQPDGTTFRARVLELEDGGGQETTDGHLITRADDGWWYYGTRQDNGKIEPTAARVGLDAAPAASESWRMPTAFKQNLARHQEYAAQLDAWTHSRYAAQAAAAAEAGEPVVFRVPALMLEINNTPFQEEHTPETIQDRYSGIGTSPTGTVTEMYLEQSFGQLVVQVDVYGIYTSGLSMNPANDCWYGTEGGPVLGDTLGLGGYGAKGLAAEAVPQADPEVDFSEYDMDGDNYVDFLMIVHSGYGAETTGDPCDVHSHRFGGLAPALVDGAPSEPTPITADGVAIGQALTVPELDAGIGVVAHELMHAFGEPDYYGTAGTSGTGDWDLGAGGSYGGIPTQSSPLHFNPVMKVNFGWVEPIRIDDTTLDVELRPRANHPDMLLVPTRVAAEGEEDHDACVNDPIGSGRNVLANWYDEDGNCLVEGYLIEFLSPTSASWDAEECTFTPADFDRQMYGTGAMVWHYDLTTYQQLGNNTRLRPMLDVEEFDRRDAVQELETDTSRAEPTDPFWGDPVGISSATAANVDTGASLPDGPSFMVNAVPGTSDTTDPWTAPEEVPAGTLMEVTLTWPTEDVDDWDMAVQQDVDGEWVEVGTATSFPGSGAEVVTVNVEPGATYRAEAVNFASASATAEVHVAYRFDETVATKLGPANTLSADVEPTGWSFTNIRPFEYLGTATPMQAPDGIVTLDLVKHDGSTVDVSGDFLRPVTADGTAEPVVAGEPVTLQARVYNHGGAAVSRAEFAVYDEDPSLRRARPIETFTRDLAGFGSDTIELAWTPQAGRNDLWVTASAGGDVVPGNDVVRTELVANPADDADVLVVDHDHGWTQEQTVQASLLSLGVPHHVVEGEPSAGTLAEYDAVIWLTTGVSGSAGVVSPAAWDALTTYLDGGGNVWLASNRAVGYAADGAVNRASQVAQYFGVVGVNNILDPMGDAMVGQGDAAIGADREIPMGYIDGRPYVDYAELATESDAAPAEPLGEVTGLFVHEQRPDHWVGARVDGDGFRTVWTPAPTGILRGGDQQQLTAEVLAHFGVATGAPDDRDERVVFNRFQHVQAGQPWEVTVGAPSADAVTFQHRVHGDDTWQSLELAESAPGLWTGTIAAEHVHNNGLDYFVEVTERRRTRTVDGGPDLPNVASGTYGDPAEVDFGACAAADEPTRPAGPPALTPAVAAPRALPATGSGVGLLGLLGLAAAAAVTRRRA